MKPADILRMIEEVSPDDTGKLDEIDARVHLYRFQQLLLDYERPSNGDPGKYWARIRGDTSDWGLRLQPYPKQYTRSRDALKAIRPEGCDFEMCPAMQSNHEATISFSWALADTGDYDSRCFRSKHLRTEELAELHAIIQAIAYERGGG